MIFVVAIAVPIVLLVLALLFEPYFQSRREQALMERMKSARNSDEAKAFMDIAIHTERDKTGLPGHWNDSYRNWDK